MSNTAEINVDLRQQIKSASKQAKVIRSQIDALPEKTEKFQKKIEALNQEIAQSDSDYDASIRANLSGSATDIDVERAFDKKRSLIEDLKKAEHKLTLALEIRPSLVSEEAALRSDVQTWRSQMNEELAVAKRDSMKDRGEIYKKLIEAHVIFYTPGGSYLGPTWDGWAHTLHSYFPLPTEAELVAAKEKLKAENEFLQD